MSYHKFTAILIAGCFFLLGCKDTTTSKSVTDGASDSTAVGVEHYFSKGISKELMDDLSAAVIQKNTKYIDTFLKLKPDLNQLNSLGETPLTLSTTLGEREIVEKFINSGANVDFPNQFGRTALHKAIIHLHNDQAPEIVSLLLENGAKTEVLDQYNAPPVYYCLFNLSKPHFDSDIALKSIKMLSALEMYGAKRSTGFGVPGLDKNRLTNQVRMLLNSNAHPLSSNQVEFLESVVDQAGKS